jgi:hypothetical protein
MAVFIRCMLPATLIDKQYGNTVLGCEYLMAAMIEN